MPVLRSGGLGVAGKKRRYWRGIKMVSGKVGERPYVKDYWDLIRGIELREGGNLKPYLRSTFTVDV